MTNLAYQDLQNKRMANVAEWTRQAGIDEDIESVLPTLRTGQPHVWSPTFLGISKTVTIAAKVSADVSMTPKVGSRVKEQLLTPIDAEKLRADMQETIEKAKADDPKELHKQISALQKEIGALKQQKPEAAQVERIEVSVLTDADREALKSAETAADFIETWGRETKEALRVIQEKVRVHKTGDQRPSLQVSTHKPDTSLHKMDRSAHKPVNRPNDSGAEMGKCERAILQVLSQYEDEGCESGKLTLLTGYRYSGGFKNSLSKLRQAGLIEGENTGVMRITPEGLQMGPFDPMPSGDELIQFWLNHRSFGSCERRILTELVRHRHGLAADKLCELTGYQYSGGFKNALSNLRTAGVIVGRNTETMKASETLFE